MCISIWFAHGCSSQHCTIVAVISGGRFHHIAVTILTLLYSLDECTKSTSLALDPEAVDKFCKAVDNDLDGPSTAARLLGHKIQSPQQQESLNALCVSI